MKNEDIRIQGEKFYKSFINHQQIDPPSVKFPDMTYEEAYAIQRVFINKLTESGMNISGKKVGLTSSAMRKIANIYEPDYGFILKELYYENTAVIPFSSFVAPRIECELAFKLSKDLDFPNITIQDVINATEYVVPCLEICDFRMYRDKVQRRIQDSIADNAAFGGYVMGDTPITIDEIDLSLVPYVFEVNNEQVEVSCGAAVYDNPANSVAWLANTFFKLGESLKKGEIILSGSAVASVPVEVGDHFRCRFGVMGDVSCKFI